MKIVIAPLFVIRTGAVDSNRSHCNRPGPKVLLRSNSIPPIKIWRRSGELVARWHVSRETGRIECSWSLEEPPADDHLCPDFRRALRRMLPTWRRSSTPRRPAIAGCHKPVSDHQQSSGLRPAAFGTSRTDQPRPRLLAIGATTDKD